MIGGNAGYHGIVLYDTAKAKKGKNAVYGCYDGNDILLYTGTSHEMRELQKDFEKELRIENKMMNGKKAAIGILLVVLLAVIYALCSQMIFIAALILAIGFYFPILSLINANAPKYKTEEAQQQFRRNNGCRHAMKNCMTKKLRTNLPTLKSCSIFDTEDNRVYMGYAMVMAAVIAILLVVKVPFVASVGIAFGAYVVMVLLNFLPKNPFLLLQKSVVAQPTEREYELGVAMMQELDEM